MNLIAHRGLYGKEVKENTLTAFKKASENNNYIGAEFDVHETKDHKFVVIHDALINRTSDGKGFIENMTYKELLQYNFGSTNNYEKIPLLEEVLEILKDKLKIIEIKNIRSFNSFNNMLNKEKNVYIASFYKKYLISLNDFKRNYKIGLFNNVFNSEEDYSIYNFIGIYYKLLTPKISKFLQEKNIEIILFGIKQRKKIKEIYNFKDYYLIVDENNLK